MTIDAAELARILQQGQAPAKPPATRPGSSVQRRIFLRGSVGNLGTGETTIFTMPALCTGRIDSITVHNPSGGALLLTLHIVANGGSAGTTNEVATTESIGSKTRASIPVNAILAQGDIVSGKGDSAGLNVWVSVEVVEQGPGFA